MSGILKIAPAGFPDDSPRRSPTAKNRSIAGLAAAPRPHGGARKGSLGQWVFAAAAGLFRDLAKARSMSAPALVARAAAQDRAIAEQDSDIAATASIARISAVTGAARAAVREGAAMSSITFATQTVIAAKPSDDMGARPAWWHPLLQLLSRLRRALLRSLSKPATGGALEVAGTRPLHWSFVPQAREFAVSRRRQSGGRVGASRMSRP